MSNEQGIYVLTEFPISRNIIIKQLFNGLYSAIETRSNTPSPGKEDLKAEVQEIQTTLIEAAQKNQEKNESFLSRLCRNIARMTPGVLDVVVARLANPLAEMGVAIKKIAEKSK